VPTQRLLVSKVESFHLTSDPLTTRVGPLVTVRLVGVAANARSEVDGGLIRFTPALYRRYGSAGLGHFVRELAVRLRNGAADLPAFRDGVHRIAGKHAYGFFDPSAGRPQLQRSVDLLTGALRLLAVVVGLAAMLLVGQALLRDAAKGLPAQPALRAIGMTRSQLVRVGALRSVVIAVPATALTVLLAYLLSPLAPIGRAGELEPHPGFRFDSSIVLPGAGIVLLALLLLGVAGTARVVVFGLGGGSGPPHGAGSRIATALGRAGFSPALGAGARMALVRRSRASAVPVRATLVAAVLAVGVTVMATTFAAGLSHLLRTPSAYGQTWDFETGGGPDLPASLLREIARDPGVAALAIGGVAPEEIAGRGLGVRAEDNIKGSVWPTLLKGRLPRRGDEALLGPKTLEGLHKRIGDTVVVRSGTRGVRVRVVGTAVMPSTKFNKLGEGAAFSFRTLRTIDPGVPSSTAEVRFADGPQRRAAEAQLVRLFDGTAAVRPTEVGDFAGVNGMPFIVAALFAAVAAAVLGHALVTAVRRRRRDIAILKTVGFTRPQVAAAVAWQATTVVVVGLLAGVPLGILAGRFSWHEFATALGVVPDAVTPVAPIVLVAPAALLLANAIAGLPGWTAARTQPALVLRAE
jgi:hypothetical protein